MDNWGGLFQYFIFERSVYSRRRCFRTRTVLSWSDLNSRLVTVSWFSKIPCFFKYQLTSTRFALVILLASLYLQLFVIYLSDPLPISYHQINEQRNYNLLTCMHYKIFLSATWMKKHGISQNHAWNVQMMYHHAKFS